VTATSADNSLFVKTVDVSCPEGKKVVGGGARVLELVPAGALGQSYPLSATTWRAEAHEIVATGANWSVQAYAICANAS
jgi:hypothetical protein